MAWTAPRTWTAGEVPTASIFNTHVRDNLKAIGDAWGAYTPSWTATTTNPVIGNGTIEGAYSAAGKLIHWWAQITMGSTTTYGTGTWFVSLPVSPSVHRWIGGVGTLRDASASATYWLVGELDTGTSTTSLRMRTSPTTAGNDLRNVTGTVPFTYTTSDVLFISGTYEAA